MGYALAHVNDRNGLIAMCVIFTVLSTSATTLRFYSRKVKGLPFQADDWLCAVALVFVIALNAMFLAGCVQHVITGHSKVVNNWPVTSELEHQAQKVAPRPAECCERRMLTRHKYKYGFQTTEKIAFGLIKISILLLWRRIFGHVKMFNRACWIMIGVVVAWTLAFFFATVFRCGIQWSKNWAPIKIFLTQCTNTINMLTAFTATDVLTDLIIISLPIPMIWSLQMSVRRKLAINAMFLVGLFAIGAGIARMYVSLDTSYQKSVNPDFINDVTIFLLWADIEVNLAMLCACLPTLLPALGSLPRTREILNSSRRLLSFSRMRSSVNKTRRSDGKNLSNSSLQSLCNGEEKPPSFVQPDGFVPRIETSISTVPHDLEMQKPLDQRIMVTKNISHHGLQNTSI